MWTHVPGGPAPTLPEEVAVYPVDVRRRLAVKPGLTGLRLVDLMIPLRTRSAVCRASGAY